MLGIENLLKLAQAVGECGTLCYLVMEDGRISFRDLGHLREAFQIVKEFASVDYKASLPEAKEMDEEEAKLLAACFAEHLKIGGGQTEEIIEAGFTMIVDLAEMLSKFSSWATK